MKHHRHSQAEIEAKLAEAANLAAEGKNQDEISRALGVSVMTFHRWRKARAGTSDALQWSTRAGTGNDKLHEISDLQLENSRLRRLVTDLLLEKLSLEESRAKKAS